MIIIVTRRIRQRELGGFVANEPEKIFAKLRDKRDLAIPITAPSLPSGTTLHKVYATSEGGARRLLFFCRHMGVTAVEPERWVLLFYRRKGDEIGDNLSARNPKFTPALLRNLQLAVEDIAANTPEHRKFEEF